MRSAARLFRRGVRMKTNEQQIPNGLPESPAFAFATGPVVFECGDVYAVSWVTTQKGSGHVICQRDGEERIFHDAADGLIRTDDTVHVVRVPKDAITDGSYRISSRQVYFRYMTTADVGETITSAPYRFRGVPPEDGMKILSISDIHEKEDLLDRTMAYFADVTPDLMILLGDVPSQMEYKSDLVTIIADAAKLSGGEIPVVYARGNHEARGEFAANLKRYFPYATGEFYFPFRFGALSALVLDPGENKADDHEEYCGLVDFASYREKEFAWLCHLDDNTLDGKYRLVISHIPKLYDFFGKDWVTPLIRLGADLMVSAHLHKVRLQDGDLPELVEGGIMDGGESFAVTLLTLENGGISILSKNMMGDVLLDTCVETKKRSE